jgi:hypothetical protein
MGVKLFMRAKRRDLLCHGDGQKCGRRDQRNRVYLLIQLRTGYSWLATHARVHGFREDNKCECGARETVVHVLVDCPHLQELRKELRSKIGDAFNDVSTILGAKP